MLPAGFEPASEARKAPILNRTRLRERKAGLVTRAINALGILRAGPPKRQHLRARHLHYFAAVPSRPPLAGRALLPYSPRHADIRPPSVRVMALESSAGRGERLPKSASRGRQFRQQSHTSDP